jgi:AcrR family transcriptional regulator
MKHTERNELTKQQIKKAFIDTIDEKGFNNLTVSDITRKAGVSRGTFYVHYTDKYDLLAGIEDELHANIQAAIAENFESAVDPNATGRSLDEIASRPYEIFSKALSYVDSERHTIRTLLSDQGHPQFFERIRGVVDDTFTESLAKNQGHLSTALPIDYTKEVVINSVLNIIRHWVNKDNPESTEELAKILMKSRFLSPHELMVFDS